MRIFSERGVNRATKFSVNLLISRNEPSITVNIVTFNLVPVYTMTVSELITAENVTLTNCDREEIHSPGSIQPHGLLFVLTEPQLEIVQVSQNTAKRLGVSAQALLGKRLSDLLGTAQVELVKSNLGLLAQFLTSTEPL